MTTERPLPVVPRHLLGADGVIQRVRLGAYAWCERDGAVLLTRVSDEGPGGGLWTLPGGGLEFGEDPVTGAIREVLEETGYTVTVGALIGIRNAVLEPAQTISGHRVQTVGIVYHGTIAGGELTAEFEGSTDAAAWIPLDELDVVPSVDLLTWTRRAMAALAIGDGSVPGSANLGGPGPVTPAGPDLPRIGAPATSVLAALGITRLEQVAAMREADALALHGVGPRAIRLLRAALAEHGLAFREDEGGSDRTVSRTVDRTGDRRALPD